MADKSKQEKKQTQKKRHAMTPEQRKLYDLRRSQKKARRLAKWNSPAAVAARERRRLVREARSVAKLAAAQSRHEAERVAEVAAQLASEKKAKRSAAAKKAAATRAANKAAAQLAAVAVNEQTASV